VALESVVGADGRAVDVQEARRRRWSRVPDSGVVEDAGGDEGGLGELESGGFVAWGELDGVESGGQGFEELVGAGLSERWCGAGSEECIGARRNSRDQRGGRDGGAEAR